MIQILRLAFRKNSWLMNKNCEAQVTIDGPAATGKTTVGKLLADQLGWSFLDTGMMYRAATKLLLDSGIDLSDKEAMIDKINESEINLVYSGIDTRFLVNGFDITDHLRENEVESKVSIVSKVAGIRESMVLSQRSIAARSSIVMVGRDIGTVVLPNAKNKIYLDASPKVRARRRLKEIKSKSLEEVTKDIIKRDKIDSQRSHAPLIVPDGAYKIDTDHLSIDEVIHKIIGYINS